MSLFKTFLPCGVLGEACPTNVWFEYFPETDTDSEHIVLKEVLVEVPTNRAVERQIFDYMEFNVLDDLTQAQKNNIEEEYLDKLHNDGEEK